MPFRKANLIRKWAARTHTRTHACRTSWLKSKKDYRRLKISGPPFLSPFEKRERILAPHKAISMNVSKFKWVTQRQWRKKLFPGKNGKCRFISHATVKICSSFFCLTGVKIQIQDKVNSTKQHRLQKKTDSSSRHTFKCVKYEERKILFDKKRKMWQVKLAIECKSICFPKNKREGVISW